MAAAAVVWLAANTYAFELNGISAKDLGGAKVQTPGPADVLPALNAAADRAMRTSVLLVVGGVKPFSEFQTVEDSPQFSILDDITLIVRSNELKNPDLVFFRDVMHPDTAAYNMAVAASKSAITRLLRDKTVIETLNKYKADIPLDIPQDCEGWIHFYKAAVAVDGYSSHGPAWANLVIGIALGYPPLEAEMYANNLQGARLLRKPVGARRPGFRLAGYMRFTDLELARDEYYVGGQNILVDNYERLIASGHGPLEIMNHPDWLTRDMPPFPEEFLLREVSGFQPARREPPSPISREKAPYGAVPDYLPGGPPPQ